MARILRGDIRWAGLDLARGREQSGHRPVLVLSHDIFNARSDTVIAVAVTSQEPKAQFPLHWQIPDGVLGKSAWVKISQIRTLSVERIGKRIARLESEQVAHVLEGLKELLGE